MATTRSDYEFLQPTVSESDSLMVTLFFATVFHIFILLGISFAIPKPDKTNKQIEITLSSTPSKVAPKDAKFLAQDNQLGAGTETIKPSPQKQQLASQGQSANKPPRLTETQIESKPKASQRLVTQKIAEEKIQTDIKQSPPSKKVKPKISEEALMRQIAQLGAKIRYSEQSSEKTKIKAVHSVSTHKYVAAQYVRDWTQKVSGVGNLNFPEIARKKGSGGKLILDVGIAANGTIYSISVRKSSGVAALDSAAKRIVRMSAPFAALPKALLGELDVLVISRAWEFSDETGKVSND